jgi:hypothetical protein
LRSAKKENRDHRNDSWRAGGVLAGLGIDVLMRGLRSRSSMIIAGRSPAR